MQNILSLKIILDQKHFTHTNQLDTRININNNVSLNKTETKIKSMLKELEKIDKTKQ